ncbi:MAG: hypothetical protein NC930_06815, partial [Candidatus Omnitrophica bacterium]|nr:hypothetical protein [Candidatus Omnitrophota bacterium]
SLILMKNPRSFAVVLAINFFLLLLAPGCTRPSYPEAKLKQCLIDICRKEYGVEELEVKLVGKTINVFLPLPKLFVEDDFTAAIAMGKIRNVESLFQPSPEALEKVEDVLFSISRVILSTDKPLDFYILTVADVERTGLELVLKGYVDDIKRVRVWDISRGEYRKRIIHELRLNRVALWHRFVQKFFRDLSILPLDKVQDRYFGQIPAGLMNGTLWQKWMSLPEEKVGVKWKILEMRSIFLQKGKRLIYVKALPAGWGDNKLLEYLFVVSVQGDKRRILNIIPLQRVNEQGLFEKIQFPPQLKLEKSLPNWDQEFEAVEVLLGPFLAQQLTRRVQEIIASDERIRNTFYEIKPDFQYHAQSDKEKSYFSLELKVALKDYNYYSNTPIVLHEDMLYFLNLAFREFVNVMRGYRFGDYDYLGLYVGEETTPWILGRQDLELFRRNKADLGSLLSYTPL